jgi:tetratricopeptide (TPR) repeat protein
LASSGRYRDKFPKLAHGVRGAGRWAARYALAIAIAVLLATGFGLRLASEWYGNLGAVTLLRGVQDTSLGNLRVATDLLRTACDLDGGNRSARRLLGQGQYWQGDDESARDSLSYGLQISSTDVLSYYWRGMVNFEASRYKEAGEDWLKAGFLGYKLQTLRDSAYGLSRQGNVAAAEAELLTANQLSPTDPAGYYALGGFYWGMPERKGDASVAFQSGLALDHSASFQRFWAEGRLRLIEKQWALAALALEKAVHANPEYKDAHAQLGYAYWQDGQIERARAVLESTVEQWPEYFDPYLYLSTIAGERGDAEKSVLYMLAYLAVEPDSARACDRLVQILSGRRNLQLIEWAVEETAHVAPASASCSSRLTQLLSSFEQNEGH